VYEIKEDSNISNFGLSKFEEKLNIINKNGQRLSYFEISEHVEFNDNTKLFPHQSKPATK